MKNLLAPTSRENLIATFGLFNKYFDWYIRLCLSRLDRVLPEGTYTERHHIYPKSIFGQNKFLVVLTAREHYIAHLLLWRALLRSQGAGNAWTKRMLQAFFQMASNAGVLERSSRSYSDLRTAYGAVQSTHMKQVRARAGSREFYSELHARLWADPAYKANMCEVRKLQFAPEEVRAKMSASRQRFYEENPEEREKVGQHFREFYKDEENREAARDRLTTYRNDPTVRAKINAKLGSDASRKANSERVKAKIANDPEYRAKVLAGLAKGRDSEESRKRQSALVKSQLQDPEFQAKRLEALRARQAADALRGSRVELQHPDAPKKRRVFPDSPEYSDLVASGWVLVKGT